MNSKTAVLLINLGSPLSPSVAHVRSYLRQFLNDPRVIDIPWLHRKLLVNAVIVPFRAPKSAKLYKKLWTDRGSPLIHFTRLAMQELQNVLGSSFEVFMAMRYKEPSISRTLEKIRSANFSRIIVLPLFPHYASATTGSVYDEVMRVVRPWWAIPEITFVGQYHDHPAFIEAWSARGKEYAAEKFDHVVFSYHGLPLRQVEKTHENLPCEKFNCTMEINDTNRYCYQATCYATTRALAQRLGLSNDRITVSFQSRLNEKWLRPFTDEVIRSLAEKGVKRVLVFSPAFTADCLETIIEVREEYRNIFIANGGEQLQLVESLNDHPAWIACLKALVTGN